MAANPQMVIRVAGTVAELKKNLAEGRANIEALSASVEKYAKDWARHSAKLTQDAHNIVAAIDKVGVSTLTAGDSARALKTLEAAMAQLERSGQPIPAQMRATADALRAVAPAATSATSALLANATAYVAGLATFETAKRALGGLVNFLTSSVEEAAKAEAGQKRLETAMKTTGVAVQGNLDAFDALAREMQRTTTLEGDQVTSLIAMGLQLGVLPSQMDGAIKAAANLSAGLGTDLETAMQMIVKANHESFTAFGKLGISIDEARAKAEGLPYVLEQINKGVGGQAAAEVETYAGRVKQLANEWTNFKETVGGAVISTGILQGAMQVVRLEIQKWQLLPGYIKGMLLAMKDGPAAMLAFGQAYEITGGMVKQSAGKISDGTMAGTQALEKLNAAVAALSAKAAKQFEADAEVSAKAAEKLKESQQKFLTQSQESTAELLKNAAALTHLGPVVASVTALEAKQADQLRQLAALTDLASREFGEFATTEQAAGARAAEANYTLAGLKTTMTDLAHGLPSATVGMDGLYQELTKTGPEAVRAGASIQSGLIDVVASVPSTFQRAFEGGGGWAGALKALAASIVNVFTAALDGAIASALKKGLSSLSGSAAGAASGAAGNAAAGAGSSSGLASTLGSTAFGVASYVAAVAYIAWQWVKTDRALAEIERNRRVANESIYAMRDALTETYGSFDKMLAISHALGVDMQSVFTAYGVEGARELQAAIDELGVAWAKGQQQVADYKSEIADLEAALTPDWGDVDGIITKYKGNVDALGHAIQQLKLREAATAAVSDWDTMARAGAEMGEVGKFMSDAINDIVKDSQRFGVALPENMKPALLKMIELGTLIDKDGQKITDISSLKFGEPVKTEADKIRDSIQIIVDKMDELITKLNGLWEPSQAAAAAFKDAWREAPWERWPEIPGGSKPRDDEADGGGGGRGPTGSSDYSFATGTGGRYINFGAGTPVMLHGYERVMTAAEGRSGAGASVAVADHTPIQNVLMFDGEILAKVLTRVARRKGWKT